MSCRQNSIRTPDQPPSTQKRRRTISGTGHPDPPGKPRLAVDVTGAAIKAEGYQFISDLLRSPQEDALEFAAELADDLPGGHASSIAATLLASIRHLNEDGLRLLHLAALLAPAPIPRSLITSVFALLTENELTGRKQSALGIKAANDEGLTESLTDVDDAVSVHVLVSPQFVSTRVNLSLNCAKPLLPR